MTTPSNEPWGDPPSRRLYSAEVLRKQYPDVAAVLDEMIESGRSSEEEVERIYKFVEEMEGQGRWQKLGGNIFSAIVILLIVCTVAGILLAITVKALRWGFS